MSLQPLTFLPQAGEPYMDPSPHYERLGELTEGLQYGELLDPTETRDILYAAHEVVTSELRWASKIPTFDESGTQRAWITEVRRSRLANCRGFVFVTSGLLERAGVQHYSGYAVGHAFMAVPTTGELLFFDPMYPDTIGPLRIHGIEEPDQGVIEGIVSLGSHAMLDEDRPWHDLKVPINLRLGENDVGRQSFRNLEEFRRLLIKGRYPDASRLVESQRYVFPEAESDIRFNSCAQWLQKAVGLLRRRNRTAGDVSSMTDLIDTYCKTLPDDGFRHQMQGDLLRELGTKTNRPLLLQSSLRQYKAGMAKPGGCYLPQKVAKTKEILQKA